MKWPRRRGKRLRAGQYFARGVAFLVFIAIVGTVRSVFALNALSQARSELIDQLGPTALSANDISIAMLDQETGLRGYVLSGERTFLVPFLSGRRDAEAALERLEGQLRFESVQPFREEIEEIAGSARDWELNYADPTVEEASSNPGGPRSIAQVKAGKARFDRFRQSVRRLNVVLGPARADGREALRENARIVTFWTIFTGVVILLSLALVAWLLRKQMIAPLQTLAGRVRDVARGDYEREVTAEGAAEVVELAEDVESMRARIVAELAALQTAEADLRRSNQELEQFAYVASHDLQEPLRKVASFCQLLQQRYGGQLDARADQYIGFAVDGAQRMQDLINDLLAFSRVGRMEQPHTDVDTAKLVERAQTDLSRAIEDSGAEVLVEGELPVVQGDASLLRLVFQNLIGNAIKFRAEAAPRVEISAEREGEEWRFRVADNGIGIDPEYAERIFVIFQRLHPRSQYEGTGIGLAMCRKVVEYHGGKMWLDTGSTTGSGSTFYFTLPAEPADTESR
ncbi:ATP-binding protein [Solirubrobacter phytolaccae]|uniref:histidine kinase n=1 Tax=Solirubrobacter phytolaccae TaxID=1404360 RepID=A0A9X3NKS7_9ACTN|nr:ATP-binding protein [Solirubrobacter phytolaccae]MDA0185411.1 ATP-binding protein [Solirubrobacter phytolaccae]